MAVERLQSGQMMPFELRVGLPDSTRPIALRDGRIVTCVRSMPNHPDTPPGGIFGGSDWTGPRGLMIIVTLDHTDAWGPLLHVSVSYAKLSRDPTWEDITAVKDAFFGDVDAMMVLPTRSDYVNIRSNCFQLWQTPERWAMR